MKYSKIILIFVVALLPFGSCKRSDSVNYENSPKHSSAFNALQSTMTNDPQIILVALSFEANAQIISRYHVHMSHIQNIDALKKAAQDSVGIVNLFSGLGYQGQSAKMTSNILNSQRNLAAFATAHPEIKTMSQSELKELFTASFKTIIRRSRRAEMGGIFSDVDYDNCTKQAAAKSTAKTIYVAETIGITVGAVAGYAACSGTMAAVALCIAGVLTVYTAFTVASTTSYNSAITSAEETYPCNTTTLNGNGFKSRQQGMPKANNVREYVPFVPNAFVHSL